MPQWDLPLKELQAYTGTNPRPADFDAYWDRALGEVTRTELKAEYQPAEFFVPFARCFHLTFSGTDGARIYAKCLLPAGAFGPGPATPPYPAVLHFHGYHGASVPWNSYLAYPAAGIAVFALDCRGQGGRSQDPGGVPGTTLMGHIVRGLDGEPEDLLYRRIFQDTALLARVAAAHPAVDADRLGAYGGSQGGALSVACAALIPTLKRVAPFYPFLSDYRRVWDMDLAKNAYFELRDWFRRFDPLHEREEEIFTRLGYIDVQNLAERIRGRVLFGASLMDEVCPPSTQYAVYNKIRAPKQMLLYKDFGHEELPGFADRTYQFLLAL